MPGNVNAKIIWENNPDTSINATNLSKSLNVISESKFIAYTEDIEDKKLWADAVLDFEELASVEYVNQIVYVVNPGKYLKCIKNQNGSYSWLDSGFPIPEYKMFKIKANTKISMSYIDTTGNQQYLNYDIGKDHVVFSNESLIIGEDFSPNTKYNIYLYNTSNLGDNAVVKIVSEYDDNSNNGGWKQGVSDPGSPTGTRVIAIRKIGGFKTNSSGTVDINSLWDLSTYQEEIITERYKILESSGVRNFVASDVPIEDVANNFISTDVEGALADVKVNVDQFYRDMYYTADRYGVELEYTVFTKQDSNIVPIDLNNNSLTIPIRITPGYINVAGSRVNISAPIYLGDNSLQIKINNYFDLIQGVILGYAPPSPYSTTEPVTTLYPAIWRVFINSDGQIILREGDDYLPKFLVEEIRKGWYYTQDNSRCIGKFRVRAGSGGFYLEKMSITNTWDQAVPKNTMYTFHGTMCPDGLFPCDGKWHDVTGNTSTTYMNMPSPDGVQWAQSWWDQTPNMYGRTVKMYDEGVFDNPSGNTVQLTIPQPAFKWELDQNQEYAIIQSGSSQDAGLEGGEISHTHPMSHQHSPTLYDGDLRIQSAQGDHHGHNESAFIVEQNSEIAQAVKYTGGGQTPLSVATGTHKHTGSVADVLGQHGHSNGSFVGLVGQPTEDNTGEQSSWSPYKEFMMCIKK